MIPNPVQRSARSAFRQSARSSDDLIVPCAQEGGTFRDPVQARPRTPELLDAEYFDGPRISWSRVWLGVCAGLILLMCWFGSSANASQITGDPVCSTEGAALALTGMCAAGAIGAVVGAFVYRWWISRPA
jgi:hypothetical protein